MSATPSATALPPGYHAPLSVVSDDNHSAWIAICNAFGLLVILITFGIRVYIRQRISPPMGRDDHLSTAATALAVVQCALVFAQVHDGLGESIDLIGATKLVEVQKLGYAADLFYILIIYTAKISVVLLFKRISPDRSHSLAAWTVLGACIVFAVISFFIVALRCELSHPWLQYSGECNVSRLTAKWSAVAAFDIITEVALFAMSIQLVWKLQTSLARKARVILAFGFRLPLIAVAALRLAYIIEQINSSNQPLVGAIAAILTQLEIFYSIMAATIPCLRPFLAGFATYYGSMGGETVMGGSQIGSGNKTKGTKNSTKGSFAMASVVSKSGKSSALRSSDHDTEDDNFRPDRVNNQSQIVHNGGWRARDASSIGSSDSTKMIIKKEVQWQVDSEGARAPSQSDMDDLEQASRHV